MGMVGKIWIGIGQGEKHCHCLFITVPYRQNEGGVAGSFPLEIGVHAVVQDVDQKLFQIVIGERCFNSIDEKCRGEVGGGSSGCGG